MEEKSLKSIKYWNTLASETRFKLDAEKKPTRMVEIKPENFRPTVEIVFAIIKVFENGSVPCALPRLWKWLSNILLSHLVKFDLRDELWRFKPAKLIQISKIPFLNRHN